jgi:peptidoglycan/LPS O-acetylase OafA/YrhL
MLRLEEWKKRTRPCVALEDGFHFSPPHRQLDTAICREANNDIHLADSFTRDSMQTKLSLPSYRAEIDGLRALAVLSVIAYHAFPEYARGGFTGVDVFFVISGYLISLILFKSLNGGSFSFADFYARRVRRIFPALAVVLAASYLFGWFFLFPSELAQLGKHIASSAGFVQNLTLWSESGYFDTSSSSKALLHLWSLGVEEQFYILWPVLLWLAWRRKLKVLAVILTVSIASFAFNLWMTQHDATGAFYLPLSRFWELLAGGALAWRVAQNEASQSDPGPQKLESATRARLRAFAPHLLSAFGLLLLLFAVWKTERGAGFPGAWATIPVLGAVSIIAAGPRAWINRYLLANPVIVWIGLISYPLYLWHWPLLSYARIIYGETPSLQARFLLIAIALILSWLTYQLIERPIRFNRRGISFVPALASIMVVVGLAGYLTFRLNGLSYRPVAQNALLQGYQWPPLKNWDPKCGGIVQLKPDSYCEISSTYPPSVAIIGDSHANALFDYFSAYFGREQRGVINLGKGGCPAFLGVERDNSSCPLVENTVIDYLVHHPEIRDVYIAGRFAATQSGIDFGERPNNSFYRIKLVDHPSIQDRNAIFKTGLSSTLDRLTNARKNVTILLDLPELNFDPLSCTPRLGLVARECTIQREVVTERQAAYRKIIQALQPAYGFRLIDMSEPFCGAEFCTAKYNGKVLYRDRQHLGIYASQYLLNKGFRVD